MNQPFVAPILSALLTCFTFSMSAWAQLGVTVHTVGTSIRPGESTSIYVTVHKGPPSLRQLVSGAQVQIKASAGSFEGASPNSPTTMTKNTPFATNGAGNGRADFEWRSDPSIRYAAPKTIAVDVNATSGKDIATASASITVFPDEREVFDRIGSTYAPRSERFGFVAPATAVGNFDDDLDDEIAVAIQDENGGLVILIQEGDPSGLGIVTLLDQRFPDLKVSEIVLATGNVDDDANDELIVGMRGNDGRPMAHVYDLALNRRLLSRTWEETFDDRRAGHLALTCGDFDGNDRDEIVIALKSGDGWPAVLVYAQDAAEQRLARVIDQRFNDPLSSNLNVATGNFDQDDADELVFALRISDSRPAVLAYEVDLQKRELRPQLERRYNSPNASQLHIAIGNTDSDSEDELAIALTTEGERPLLILADVDMAKHEIRESRRWQLDEGEQSELWVELANIDGTATDEILLSAKNKDFQYTIRVLRADTGASTFSPISEVSYDGMRISGLRTVSAALDANTPESALVSMKAADGRPALIAYRIQADRQAATRMADMRYGTVRLPTQFATLNDYPDDEHLYEIESEEINGVAQGNGYWFWSNNENENGEIQRTLNDSFNVNRSTGVPGNLKRLGYWHFGDIDFYDGLLYAALDHGPVPLVIVYDEDLNFVKYGSFPSTLEPNDVAWVAINPNDGLLYTHGKNVHTLNAYRTDFENGRMLTHVRTIDLEFRHVLPVSDPWWGDVHNQGGAFSKHGIFYLVLDHASDEDSEYTGVHVFNLHENVGTELTVSNGVKPFIHITYDPDSWGWRYEELEGITVVDNGAWGNVHVLRLESDVAPGSDDEAKLHHFSVNNDY